MISNNEHSEDKQQPTDNSGPQSLSPDTTETTPKKPLKDIRRTTFAGCKVVDITRPGRATVFVTGGVSTSTDQSAPTPAIDKINLPKWIPLGTTERRDNSPNVPPSEVRSAADLPRRISLGDLDEQSFKGTDDGWRVLYRDAAPDTYLKLEYRRAVTALSITMTWRGHTGLISDVPAEEFANLAQGFMVFPEQWDRQAKEDLASRFNVQYLDTPEHWGINGFFPDGYAKTVVCPVPVSKLSDCLAWYDHVCNDETIRTPVMAALKLGWSVVNYVEGISPQAAQDPLDVAMATTRALGTPLVQLPELQGPAGGSRALTVKRSHYVLLIRCFFRDLERLIGGLHRFGLVGDPVGNEIREGYPQAHEYGAVILPPGGAEFLYDTRFFDARGSRRLVYPQLVSSEELREGQERLGRPQVLELIQKAEQASVKLIAELERG